MKVIKKVRKGGKSYYYTSDGTFISGYKNLMEYMNENKECESKDHKTLQKRS